jgi:hypothetical protein
MFDRLNSQQQPYVQSGYGAMSRLNTLLGLGGPSGGAGGMPAPRGAGPGRGPSSAYAPTPEGGIEQRIPSPAGVMPQGVRLKQILAVRAQNGDTEAARMLGQV